MADKKSDLVPRLITAVVAIPILLYIIFAAPKWMFFLLLVWAGGTSVWEYCNITFGESNKGGVVLATLLGVGTYSTFYWAPEHGLGVACGSVVLVFLYFLFKYGDQKQVSHEIGSAITGIFYGAVLLGTLAFMNRDTGSAGPIWILMTLAIVWLSDTGAYFSGRAFGKRKLYEAVSPNKSVEGAVGGFIVSVAGVYGMNLGFAAAVGDGYTTQLFGIEFLTVDLAWKELSIGTMLLIAIPANILGQLGDLAESLIKRAHGVKDSGTVIYGHGGILDRIDALIFASPWVYYCVTFFV